MVRLVLPLPIALLSLAACAGERGGPYPSLAQRPVEKGSFDEPSRPVAVATPDAALDADLAGKSRELDRIAAGFAAAAGEARGRVDAATRAAVGSEPWLAAQAALARLDDWRSQASALAAGLEGDGSARAAKLEAAYPALDALAARAAAEVERENGEIRQLQTKLPGA